MDVTSKAFEPSWIFTVISWLLFCTPVLYLQRLDEIWIDLNVNHRPWRRFIAEIQEDWAASITPVCLAVSTLCVIHSLRALT